MANPTGSVTFDKATYAPGDKMTATVSYADADTRIGTAAFDLTDGQGNVTPVVGTFSIADPVGSKVNAANDRVWTKVAGSDTGSSVKFTATA